MTRFLTLAALLALSCLAAPALPAAGTEIPVAVDDNVAINFGQLTRIDVLVNDFGLADGPIVIEITQQPLYGPPVNVESQDDGTFVTYIYNDATAFASQDSFRYRLRDVDGDLSNEATVTIFPENVLTARTDPEPGQAPPGPPGLPSGLGVPTNTDQPVRVDVLANDAGLLRTPIQISIVAEIGGTAVVNGDNTVTFSPYPGFSGINYVDALGRLNLNAGFDYQLTDSEGTTSTATALVDVYPDAVTDTGSSALDPALLALLAACAFLRPHRPRR